MRSGLALTAKLASLALVAFVLGVPITDFSAFLLFTIAVMVVSFGEVRDRPLSWLAAAIVGCAIIVVNWMIPGPRIQEGHNVYIPVGVSRDVFERELPSQAQRAMLAVFQRAYFDESKKLPGDPNWWLQPKFNKPGALITKAFAPSADALWSAPKYSRIVDGIEFHSQNEARIDAINSKAFNFYDRANRKKKQVPANFSNSARIDRSAMPFFVMFEVNASLIGGTVCWRGDVLWEKQQGHFDQQHTSDRTCQTITSNDLGKRIFALAIEPDAPRDFSVTANSSQCVLLWLKRCLKALGVVVILILVIRIDAPVRLLLPFGAMSSTLLTFFIYWPDLVTGFRTHDGGNDGLLHEAFGFSISQAVVRGDFQTALKGGEDVFFFMPGLRYLRALEDFLFGSTSYGSVLLCMFIPIFLFYLLRQFLPLRWSVSLILLFMFTPVFERMGFAQFLYVREMWKGFPEPIGYGAFLAALALTAQLRPDKIAQTCQLTLPTAWIGLALALSVALRPNLAIASALLVILLAIWLAIHGNWRGLIFLGIGLSPIILVPLHNWYFGGRLVLLTSNAFIPANLRAPPSMYLQAIYELLLGDAAGPNVTRVAQHLAQWNSLSDVYRLPILAATLWAALRSGSHPWLRGLALIALSLQAVLFFYFASGRYAYLAWLLTFLVFLIVLWESLRNRRWRGLLPQQLITPAA